MKSEIEYSNIVKRLVKKLGNKALSDVEINNFVINLNLSNFKGCIFQNNIMPTGNCTYIVNTDLNGGRGIHWVAVVQHNKTVYIYDSFGRKANNIINYFTQNRIANGYKIKNTDLKDAEQFGTNSVTCGHRCISSLMIHKKYGIKGFMEL